MSEKVISKLSFAIQSAFIFNNLPPLAIKRTLESKDRFSFLGLLVCDLSPCRIFDVGDFTGVWLRHREAQGR